MNRKGELINSVKSDRTMNVKRIVSILKQFQSYIALIIIFVVGSLINVRNGENIFLDLRNLMNVMRSISETGILAIGMTMILILGDIDLSVGSVVGLVGTGCASLMVRNQLPLVPAIVISLAIAGLYGLFNGLCVTKLRLQAFIVTLASMNIARGLARYWSNGIGIPLSYGTGEGQVPPAFGVLQERIAGVVPVPVIVFIILLVFFQFVLSQSSFGRKLYALGGNKKASYLAGINVDLVKIAAFILCSMLAGVAAMIHAAQISQGGPNEGIGYELNAVAACAIGGTSLAGGKGTMVGTLVGAVILGLLDNVLGLKGVNSNIQLVVKGALIIIAVFMQAERKND